jgi:SpoVK/Ycf46/Vps4 family AAA+-type ATPase
MIRWITALWAWLTRGWRRRPPDLAAILPPAAIPEPGAVAPATPAGGRDGDAMETRTGNTHDLPQVEEAVGHEQGLPLVAEAADNAESLLLVEDRANNEQRLLLVEEVPDTEAGALLIAEVTEGREQLLLVEEAADHAADEQLMAHGGGGTEQLLFIEEVTDQQEQLPFIEEVAGKREQLLFIEEVTDNEEQPARDPGAGADSAAGGEQVRDRTEHLLLVEETGDAEDRAPRVEEATNGEARLLSVEEIATGTDYELLVEEDINDVELLLPAEEVSSDAAPALLDEEEVTDDADRPRPEEEATDYVDNPLPTEEAMDHADSALLIVEVGTGAERAADGQERAGTYDRLLPPVIMLSPAGYETSAEHLWDELQRVDLLVRAQTVRWLQTIGDYKPENLWGMVHVTDAEVAAYLQAPFARPAAARAAYPGAVSDYEAAAADMAAWIAARHACGDPPEPLRLAQLCRIFQLSPVERDVLLICLLPEIDGRYRRLFGYLQDDASRTRPTIELALQILVPHGLDAESGRNLFAASGSLTRRGLLVAAGDTPADEPLPLRSIRIDDRIAGFLLGNDEPDDRLVNILMECPCTRPANWDELIIDQKRKAALQDFARWWQNQRAHAAGGATLFLHGPYGSGRRTAACAICADSGTDLLVVDVGAALRSPVLFEQIVDLAYREARLRGATIYWAGCDQLLEPDQPASRWQHLVAAAEGFAGLTFLASSTAWDPANRFHDQVFLRLEFPIPTYDLRVALWQRYLRTVRFADPQIDRGALAELLANSFQLTAGQMRDALATARELAAVRMLGDHGDPAQPALRVDDLYDGCRRQSGQRLIAFARRVEPSTQLTFADLILPDTNKQQLEELRQRIRYRSQVFSGLGFERRLTLGNGLTTLFTGSSGTGKTMAAGLLAREQRVDLYKIDLSSVVSKYVGETEKNLSRIFAEAENSNAIIFFDEADALFGKRGEVKEAQDRWANIEVNFLLQRIEEYAGVVILATNLRQNIDEAFLRRIHRIVEFPFPDEHARKQIWIGMFPGGLGRPTDDDLGDLAQRFALPGGSIRNIVLDATFLALTANSTDAGGTTQVRVEHLVRATAREYQKLGKPLNKGEFGEEYYEWIEDKILLLAPLDCDTRFRIWLEAFPPEVVTPNSRNLRDLADRFKLRQYSIQSAVRAAIAHARRAGSAGPDGRLIVTLAHLARGLAETQRDQGLPVTCDLFGDELYELAVGSADVAV